MSHRMVQLELFPPIRVTRNEPHSRGLAKTWMGFRLETDVEFSRHLVGHLASCKCFPVFGEKCERCPRVGKEDASNATFVCKSCEQKVCDDCMTTDRSASICMTCLCGYE